MSSAVRHYMRPVPPPPPQRTWSSVQIASAMGATLRQLQWWDERGLLGHVQQNGHGRRFDEAAALRVSLVVNLRRRGLSLQRIRKVQRILARSAPSTCPYYVVVSVAGTFARFALSPDTAIKYALEIQGPVIVARIGEELENL